MNDSQLALVVSVASAVLAGISFLWTIGWSIWQHRRLHRPRISVLSTNSLPVGGYGKTGPWCLGVTVVNDGSVTVTITSLKLTFRGDAKRQGIFPQWVHSEPHAMPVRIAPGERWHGLTELAPLQETLREHFGSREIYDVWVIAGDAADRYFRGKFSIAGR